MTTKKAAPTRTRRTTAAGTRAKTGTPVKAKAKAKAKPPVKARPKVAPVKARAKAAPRKRISRAPKPKGLEASYSGRVFRSRLEARWAVFLDLLGINWDYEPCHYQVGPELFYLPDFYLPDHRIWLEVKGVPFMDAASMAKCLAAVAGPQPVPHREFPYSASDSLLLGGDFKTAAQAKMPVHTMIRSAAPGMASLHPATFGIGADGAAAIAVGAAWDKMPATGVKAARRPTPQRLGLLLDPQPMNGSAAASVRSAYAIAHSLVFDDTAKTLTSRHNPDLAAVLALRRAGRPLGQIQTAAASTAQRRAA